MRSEIRAKRLSQMLYELETGDRYMKMSNKGNLSQ